MPDPRRAVLINFGDLPSLLALASRFDPGRVVLAVPCEDGPAARRRRAMVQEQATRFGVHGVLDLPQRPPAAADADHPATSDLQVARMLMDACETALASDAGTVIWPLRIGPHFDLAARAARLASLVPALFEGPVGGVDGNAVGDPSDTAGEAVSLHTPIVIDLPLIDLTAEQVAEAAEHAGVPWDAFWPCTVDAEEPCGSCDECRLWQGGFERLGLEWPFPAAARA